MAILNDREGMTQMNQELVNVVKIYSTGTHQELSSYLIGNGKLVYILSNFYIFLSTKLIAQHTIYLQLKRATIWLKKQFQTYCQRENVKSG